MNSAKPATPAPANPRANWPADVNPISIDDLGRLGIDSRSQLFWDGSRIEIRRRLDLTKTQQFAALLVTLAAVLGGLGGFFSGLTDANALYCGAHGGHYWLCRVLPAP
jgi:hypothetical protein